VKAGHIAENEVVGAPTGILDQSASLLGRADSGIFIDCRSLESDVIPLGFDEAGLEVLVMDTKVHHEHATGGYAARRASCEAGAKALGVSSLREVSVADLPRARDVLDGETFRRVRHVVTENQRVLDTVSLLRAGQLRAIGPLLSASHASMRDDYEITVPPVDTAVAAALSAGAYGARMTGGGFGGCVLALTDAGAVDEVATAVRSAFATNGFTEPATFLAVPSQGAGRLS
jgi:galactokinase